MNDLDAWLTSACGLMAAVFGKVRDQDFLIQDNRARALCTRDGACFPGCEPARPNQPAGIGYFGLEAAREELQRRQGLVGLREKIAAHYREQSERMNADPVIRSLRREQGLPERVDLYSLLPNAAARAPYAVLTRQIATLNFETLWFLLTIRPSMWRNKPACRALLRDWLGDKTALFADADMAGDILQYQEDGFSFSNSFKRSLLDLRVATWSQDTLMVCQHHLRNVCFDERTSIGAIRLNSGHGGEPGRATLGRIHNATMHCFLPDLLLRDISLFFRSIFRGRMQNKARSNYKLYLMFAMQHVILMENFILSTACPGEKRFTESIVLPALEEIESEFGLQPLIVPVSPFRPEALEWYYHPLSPGLAAALKSQDIPTSGNLPA
ncbi:hypothetical protein [Desulfonatronum thioautotrophicum]|uniref:hypothetical protein n=1 Tax=Desulfonatronum thioautotrophicum TaxID=617001 RepID=UPI001294787B|nr:hypothetical protein [Desulfonatronum thioautotrophicum]